jgi:hypothetical protein
MTVILSNIEAKTCLACQRSGRTGIAVAKASIFNTEICKKNKISLSSLFGQSTKATNADGYNFPARPLSLNNGIYKYPKTSCDKKFDKEVVRYWENFALKWQISDNANGPWIDVETSKNYMYVTYKAPIVGTYAPGHIAPTNAQHTLLHLGCLNANGLSNSNNIVDAIYNEFTDRNVRRFDGAGPIQYWGTNISSPACWQPSQMLINLDGRCGGWAAMFHVIIRLQGIASGDIAEVDYNKGLLPSNSISNQTNDVMLIFVPEYINVHTLDPGFIIDGPPRSLFYVKNWNLSISIPDKFFVHHFYNDQAGISTLPITLLNGFVVEDKEQYGSPAQGIANPRSEFENHAIFKYNDKYYDPSYGSSVVKSGNSWENQSIDAIGDMVAYYQINPINGLDDLFLINWLDSLNNSILQQLNINP